MTIENEDDLARLKAVGSVVARTLQAMGAALEAGRKLNEIGRAAQSFADRSGYTIIRNLASHGTGTALHEHPTKIATWDEPTERRRITNGLVVTIEPLLSLGSEWAMDGGGEWTLMAMGGQPTVQNEHTLVATPRGAVVVTQAN